MGLRGCRNTNDQTTQRGEIRRCMARGARWAEFNFEQPYVLWYSVYGQCSRRRTKHQPPILCTLLSRFRLQFAVVSPPEQVTDPRSFDKQSSSIGISIHPPSIHLYDISSERFQEIIHANTFHSLRSSKKIDFFVFILKVGRQQDQFLNFNDK